MGYALYTYHWRANSIRKGGRGPYDDRLGPVSTLRHLCLRIFFNLEVLDTPLRRPSGFVAFNRDPQPRTHHLTVSVIVNFILRFTEGN